MLSDIVSVSLLGRRRMWALVLVDRLTGANAAKLAESLLHQARTTGCTEIYLDLRSLRSLDEYVLLRLADLHFELEQRGGRLWTIQVQAEVYQTFNAYGLTAALRVHPSTPLRPFAGPVGRRWDVWQLQ
jgi:anti-anti-sigma factor